jgi:hypothetical protein
MWFAETDFSTDGSRQKEPAIPKCSQHSWSRLHAASRASPKAWQENDLFLAEGQTGVGTWYHFPNCYFPDP